MTTILQKFWVCKEKNFLVGEKSFRDIVTPGVLSWIVREVAVKISTDK